MTGHPPVTAAHYDDYHQICVAPVGVPVRCKCNTRLYCSRVVDRGCMQRHDSCTGGIRVRGRHGSGGSNTAGATGAGRQQSELHGGCHDRDREWWFGCHGWTRFIIGRVASTGGAVATGGAASATGGSPAVGGNQPLRLGLDRGCVAATGGRTAGGANATGGASATTGGKSSGGASTTGGATNRGRCLADDWRKVGNRWPGEYGWFDELRWGCGNWRHRRHRRLDVTASRVRRAYALVLPTTSRVVGTGTAASCTYSALNTAVTAGGSITFNCGTAPVTMLSTAQSRRVNRQS